MLLLACVDPATTTHGIDRDDDPNPTPPQPETLPGDTNPTNPTDPDPALDLCQSTLTCSRVLNTEANTCRLTVTDSAGTINYDGLALVATRGRSSAGVPKPQYRVELVDQYGLESPANLLGMGQEDDWILHGNYYDRLLVRNTLGFDLYRDFGGSAFAPESRFCELTLNGALQGVYSLIERIDRDDDRLDLVADDGNAGSFITVLDDDVTIHPNNLGYGGWELVYPSTDNGAIAAWFDEFEYAFSTGPAQTFTAVDLDSAVDIVLLEEAMRNNDAWYLSLYAWRDDHGPLHFTPWDLDLTLGQPNYNDNENPEGWIAYRPTLPAAFGTSTAFRARLEARWSELRAGPMATDAVLGRIDTYQATLGDSIDRNFEVYPISSVDFSGYLHPVSTYEEEDAWVRSFITARLTWMDENIDGW